MSYLKASKLLLVIFVFFIASSANAQWSNDPSINTAICTATSDQNSPQTVSDGFGGVIITWQDYRGGATRDIYAQRVNSLGVIQWTANGVAICTATGDQYGPKLTSDGSGGAIITWVDSRGATADIYAQRVNSTGIVQWTANGVSICTASMNQQNPQIISDGSGGAIITWEDLRGGIANDIYAQKINSIGIIQWTVDGVAICSDINIQSSPQLISDGSSGAIITWYDNRLTGVAEYDIFAQRINSSGVVQWTVDGVTICTATGTQGLPQLVSDGLGGAIITWIDNRGANTDIYAQRINSSGIVQWTVDGITICTALGVQYNPLIMSDGLSGAIIAWYDSRAGASYDIYAQRINSSGVVQWTADGVAICIATNVQQRTQLVSDGGGGAIITWEDLRGGATNDIYAQRINSSGVVQWTADGVAICTAANAQQRPLLVGDGSGNAIITWEDLRGGVTSDIYTQKVQIDGTLPSIAPSLTSTAASTITGVSATSGGTVSSDGGASVTARGVVWSTSTSPTTILPTKTSDGTGTGAFASSITGLSLNTTYYVRAYATNSVGTSYGNEISFITLNISTLTSTAASAIAGTTATTGGNISSDGGASVTNRGVIYGTLSSPELSGTSTTTTNGTGTGVFTSSLTGLSLNTTYFVRAYATSSVGTSYGSEISFTTLDNPSLSTTAVLSITGISASSGGNVTSDGGASVTARGVVWSTSTSPTTILATKTSDGTGTGVFTSSLTGLSLNTTYFVRAYATSSVGTSYGNEVSFTTLNTPTLSTTVPSTITGISALSGGNISLDGGSAITARGVVWSTSTNPTIALATKSTDGTGTGAFPSTITGLSLNTTYYVRAYATNIVGTSYGAEETFTTLDIPTLTTTAISSITGTSASSGANISNDGGASVTARGVVWSTSPSPTTALATKTSDGAGTGVFTSAISGLNFVTTYYVRAYATNSVGTAYGNETNFTSNASSIVSLDLPSTLTTDKIIITANATSDGGAVITERGIVLSNIINPTISSATKHIDIGTGLGSFSSTFSGLSSGTRYYLRSYAINADGISYSANSTIYTIDTDGISEVEENKAPNGDGNGDGIADASQENVVSFAGVKDNIYTISCLNTNQILNTQNYTKQSSGGYSYPYGVFAYTINASSATVTMYFHGTSSLSKYVYRKLSASGRWINFEHATFGYTNINGVRTATVTLELTDGDPASDLDGIVNGVIVDPGGPALLIDDTANIPVWDWRYVCLLFILFGIKIRKIRV